MASNPPVGATVLLASVLLASHARAEATDVPTRSMSLAEALTYASAHMPDVKVSLARV